jgi:hypothetical protein
MASGCIFFHNPIAAMATPTTAALHQVGLDCPMAFLDCAEVRVCECVCVIECESECVSV